MWQLLQDCKLPLRYCDARVHASKSDVCSLSAQHLRSVVQVPCSLHKLCL